MLQNGTIGLQAMFIHIGLVFAHLISQMQNVLVLFPRQSPVAISVAGFIGGVSTFAISSAGLGGIRLIMVLIRARLNAVLMLQVSLTHSPGSAIIHPLSNAKKAVAINRKPPSQIDMF